jgi:hypothetical protein
LKTGDMEKERVEEIQKEVEKEFPGDFALQQVHMARKLLAEEAKEKGINFVDYIKMQVRKKKVLPNV